jgi:hypothetical protein
MVLGGCSSTRPDGVLLVVTGRAVVDLVDVVVAAVDVDRVEELARLRGVLAAFGGAALFDAELRLNGTTRAESGCECCGEGW